MAEFERVSYAALEVIPYEHQLLMHRMYEDGDLEGAQAAETIFDFINQEAPDTFVIILANNSVSPPCCNQELHYDCDFYAPYWYTVLVSKATWEEYKNAVMEKDQEWKREHGCKVKPIIYPDVTSAQEALDRGEEVRIEVAPFQVDPRLVQKAIDLQSQERLEQWKREQAQ